MVFRAISHCAMYYASVVARCEKKEKLVRHWHMLLCGAFVLGGVGLAIAGVGGAIAILPVVGCMAMMGAMMLMMSGGAKR